VTPPARNRSCLPRNRLRSTAGFSLLELSVVTFIISVLFAIAVPGYVRLNVKARSTAAINDLRVFAGSFTNYAHDRGEWPASTGVPGEIPPGMAPYLSSTAWEHSTPIGGFYTWAPNSLQRGARYRAVLTITSVGENKVSTDLTQLTDIDQRLDDGNLTSGNFILGFRNQPVFVIEQ
jgi:prepilin-type N-terminal cleavage/methylation domain-containing protein